MFYFGSDELDTLILLFLICEGSSGNYEMASIIHLYVNERLTNMHL